MLNFRKQAEAELGTAKTGAPDYCMLESPAKVLPGGIEENSGNSLENIHHFGWDNTGGGVAIESERLPDSDQELGISIKKDEMKLR